MNSLPDFTTTSPLTCACGCGRQFTPPPSALHKRFATAACRQRFHLAQRADAFAALRQQHSNRDASMETQDDE